MINFGKLAVSTAAASIYCASLVSAGDVFAHLIVSIKLPSRHRARAHIDSSLLTRLATLLLTHSKML